MHIVIDSFLETEKKTDSSVKPAPATVSKRKVYTPIQLMIVGYEEIPEILFEWPKVRFFFKFYEKSKLLISMVTINIRAKSFSISKRVMSIEISWNLPLPLIKEGAGPCKH